MGPSVFGDVSPTFAWENPATKEQCMLFSKRRAARPLLSPEMRVLLLYKEVPCTGNQFRNLQKVRAVLLTRYRL